jgi:hypothetical protein
MKLKELQQLIVESRSKIESHSKELDELEVAIPPDDSPSTSRKRKFGEDIEGDGSVHQAEAEAAGQREL